MSSATLQYQKNICGVSGSSVEICTCRSAFLSKHDEVRIETEQSARCRRLYLLLFFSFLFYSFAFIPSMTSFYLSVEDNKLNTETIRRRKKIVFRGASCIFFFAAFFFLHCMFQLIGLFLKCIDRLERLKLFSYRRRSANY